MKPPADYQSGYHAYAMTTSAAEAAIAWHTDTRFTYTFRNFFHPFVGELLAKLNTGSVRDLLDPEFHRSLETPFFDAAYHALTSDVVKLERFPKAIATDVADPYAVYNWELCFHLPLAIAVHLSNNQRFEEAQRWFHLIFDPTATDPTVPAPQRSWRFLAFREPGAALRIEQLLELLSKPPAECTAAETELRQSLLDGYEAIRNQPFMPHAVARTRQLAYQYCVVMKYLDNLIAWGDSLFRQDTVESINEATQRYVLAANLLGARPQRIPPRGAIRPRTFAELRAQGLDELGNALVALEGQFPFNLAVPAASDDPDAAEALFGLGRTLYFCVPQNDKLLGYWDTVDDRLFKLRNCMNLEGVVRQLALFDPPIDPGLLVKAAAAGLDLGSLIAGLHQPVGPVRARVLIQKALELCGEVRGLGTMLLSAIEKRDAERLARLRQDHEVRLHELTREARYLQWKQAEEATSTLERSRATALERYRYYQRLLGVKLEDGPDEVLALERRELTEDNFDDAFGELVGVYRRAVAKPGFAPFATKSEGRLALHQGEYDALNGNADRALAARIGATSADGLAAALATIPDFEVKAAYWGVGTDAKVAGGSFFANVGRAISSGFTIGAQIEELAGQRAATVASYQRRADDWTLQCRLAAEELAQIGRQLLGSLIAEQTARREYLTMQTQIEQARVVRKELREKFTNEELYTWHQGELSRLYYECYRFAVDAARKAEAAMKQELMRPELDRTSFIKFDYWDTARKGLLCGEALYLDLKRMELAHLEHDKREYELTRHVSLRQLAPAALLALKATGSCEVAVPEWLYALDAPGLYMRRLKHVSVSIPSVTGPYTSVSCTLSLQRSTVRISPALANGAYARESTEDPRFRDYVGGVRSVVTSSAADDGGMFETNLRDERFLPFEGFGAESTWRLELPAEWRQFDYRSISDVVLHVRYTAREGGAQLAAKAADHLDELFGSAPGADLVAMFGLRDEFPTAWSAFAGAPDGPLAIAVRRDFFPYFTEGREIVLHELRLIRIANGALEAVTPTGLDLAALGDALSAGAMELALPTDPDVLVRDVDAAVFLAIRYSLA